MFSTHNGDTIHLQKEMHNHFSKIAYRSPDFIIPHSLSENKNEALFIVLSKRFPSELQSNFHSRLWPHKNPFNCVASPGYHPHAPGCAHYHYHESRLWIRPASQVLWEPPFLGMTWSSHPRPRRVPTLGVMSCSHIPESAVSLQKLIP